MNWNEFLSQLSESLDRFFNPDLSGYTNFSFGSSLVSAHAIIWGLYIGMLLASVRMIYIKTCHGKLVRGLLTKEALYPDRAMTLAELGLEKYLPVLLGLRGTALKKVIRSTEYDEYITAVKKDYAEYETKREEAKQNGGKKPILFNRRFDKKPTECHYYIPEENKYAVEMRYNQNGSGYGTFFFVMFVGFICVLIIYALLPGILTLTDGVLNNFTVKGNTYIPQ